MISTAQPAKCSGNHPASSRQSGVALACNPLQGCPSKMGFKHFISLADDQRRQKSQGRAMNNKWPFLLVKIRWPVSSTSHTLLELCLYLSFTISATLLSFTKHFPPRATIWTLSGVKTINNWFSWSGMFLSFISIMDVCIKYSCFQFFLLILNIICFGKEKKNKQSAIHFSSKTAGLIRRRCIMFYSEMLVLTWKHRKQFRQPLIVTSKLLAHADSFVVVMKTKASEEADRSFVENRCISMLQSSIRY